MRGGRGFPDEGEQRPTQGQLASFRSISSFCAWLPPQMCGRGQRNSNAFASFIIAMLAGVVLYNVLHKMAAGDILHYWSEFPDMIH